MLCQNMQAKKKIYSCDAAKKMNNLVLFTPKCVLLYIYLKLAIIQSNEFRWWFFFCVTCRGFQHFCISYSPLSAVDLYTFEFMGFFASVYFCFILKKHQHIMVPCVDAGMLEQISFKTRFQAFFESCCSREIISTRFQITLI